MGNATPDLSTHFVKAAGGFLILAAGGLLVTGIASAATAGAASTLVTDALLAGGAGAAGFALWKAPEYAAA